MIRKEQDFIRQSKNTFTENTIFQKTFKQQHNSFFLLINLQSMMSLREEIRQKHSESDTIQVMGTLANEENVHQFWMIKPIGNNRKVEIVHFFTDEVLDYEDEEIKLSRGKQKPQQLFEKESAKYSKFLEQQKQSEYVRFRTIHGSYLSLDGILFLSKYKEDDQTQIFIKRRIQNIPPSLKQYLFIVDPIQSKECFDVTGASKLSGAQVCIWQVNNRANQRWIFEPPLMEKTSYQTYRIKNFLSGLYLNVNHEKKLIQSTDDTAIWQLKKQHQYSGELFCTKLGMYLDKGEEKKLIFRYDVGKRWKLVTGMH